MNTQDLQKKAETIKQELLTLKQKGYGNIDTSQIKGDLSSLPSLSNTPEKTLPESSPSNLLSFKDVLSKATDLAREKRNALSLSFMSSVAPSGTMAASDFNSILGNMNTASEKFIEEKTKGTQSKFELRNVGKDLMEFELDASGKVIKHRVVVSEQKPAEIKDISGLSDIENITTKDLKNEVRKTFNVDFKNKLLQELTDEQLREFMVDYKNKQNEEQMTIEPGNFYEDWKRGIGIKDKKQETLTDDDVIKLMDSGYSDEEIQSFIDKGLNMEQINANK